MRIKGAGTASHARCFAGALAFVAFVSQLAAQSQVDLAEGARVRLQGPTLGTLVGRVNSLTPDALQLRVSGQKSDVTVPWSSVSTVQVSTDRRSHTRIGALAGLGLGVAAAAYAACCTEYSDPGEGGMFAIGLLVFAGPGAGVGALVGSQIRSDVWQDVALGGTRRGADWPINRNVALRFGAPFERGRVRGQPPHLGLALSVGVTVRLGR